MTNDRNILNRFYGIVILLLVFVFSVSFKLLNIQFVHGEDYEKIGRSRVYKNFIIPANRGNLYDDTGSLLATSVPKYDIYFDPLSIKDESYFNSEVTALAKALSGMLGGTVNYHKNRLIHARRSHNRYLPIAKNLRYSEYLKIKQFPIFKRGTYG